MSKVREILSYLKIGNKSAELVLGNLTFLAFITSIGIIYIANAHYAEKKVRQIQSMEREIKDIRSKSISVKADLMVNSRLAEIEKDVAPFNIKMTNNPPLVVVEK